MINLLGDARLKSWKQLLVDQRWCIVLGMNRNFEGTARNVDRLLRYNAITRTELADYLGFTVSAVSQKLSGNCFTLRDVSRIADLFDVSVDSLIGREPLKVA